MADTTHYARARQALEDPNEATDDVSLNASLAISTATREISTTIIAQTREFATRLHDIASALEPDAGLVRFSTPEGPIYVNPVAVAFVAEHGTNTGATAVTAVGGSVVVVDASVEDVAAKLGVSA